MASFRIGRAMALLVLFLLAGSVWFVYSSYQRDVQRARERISTGSQVLDTRCGPIEYAVAGDGPPVAIVHGAGGGYDQGFSFGEPLIHSGFRVIAMSRFGYLRTPRPADASAPAQADAHACLLDALKIQRVAIIGVLPAHPLRCNLRYGTPTVARP